VPLDYPIPGRGDCGIGVAGTGGMINTSVSRSEINRQKRNPMVIGGCHLNQRFRVERVYRTIAALKSWTVQKVGVRTATD